MNTKPRLRLALLLLPLIVWACTSSNKYVPFQQITYTENESTKLFWLSAEQAPPESARNFGEFEYVAKNEKEADMALKSIEEDAINIGANTIYVERYTRSTTATEAYIFSIKGSYLLSKPDSVNDILWRRETALDTCNCIYVYVFRSQHTGGGHYALMDVVINDEAVGGLANQKGYKLQVPSSESITVTSSAKATRLNLETTSGYLYIHGFSEVVDNYYQPGVIVLTQNRPRNFFMEVKSFHGRLLAESLYLERM